MCSERKDKGRFRHLRPTSFDWDRITPVTQESTDELLEVAPQLGLGKKRKTKMKKMMTVAAAALWAAVGFADGLTSDNVVG